MTDIPLPLSELCPKISELQLNHPKLLNCDSVYLRGDKRSFHKSSFRLAIIGSRRSTEYGRRVVQELLAMLRGSNICIVSGGAIGIDACAHEAAIKNGLATRAWLVGPIGRPGPQCNSALFERIERAEGSAILVPEVLESESGLRQRLGAKAWLLRNAWIAADADCVLVVEAQVKSGTWQTAKDAAEMSKELYLVPGSIFSKSSQGISLMISRGHGQVLTDLKLFAESLLVCAARNSYNVDRGE
ncbi:hypothetical protein GW916_12615 [bacterium]|nr:hypothetical protein [bacterium]